MNSKINSDLVDINFEDIELPKEFESAPRVYGGISLENNEKTFLELSPKFALYGKLDEIRFRSDVEKSFTKLRWQSELSNETNNKDDGDNISKMEAFYDDSKKTFDLSRVPATKVPFNKRIYMPTYANEQIESKIAFARCQLNSLIKNHVQASKGMENLKPAQRLGLKRLKQRIKDKEIVCYPTDKSGRMSVDKPQNYVNSMESHQDNTIEVTVEEYRNVEKLLNSHVDAWFRILKGNDRLRNNYKSENNPVPPLYGLRKDHKKDFDLTIGPPTRPVCGGIVSSNHRISHFLSQVLKPIIKEAESTCDSTEDLLCRVRHCNDHELLDNCIIGSMDVEALYPSIDIDFSLSCCAELLMESDVSFENVDYSELGLFLALTNSRDELIENDLDEFCPRRENVSGRKPKLQASGTDNDEEVRWRNWLPPERQPPNDETRKRMIVCALVTSMKVVMKNHIYQFDNRYLKQKDGGAIGVGLAGEIANVFMVWWDREFRTRIQQRGVSLKLYSRYVDDVDLVSTTLSDEDNPSSLLEKETMEFLQQVANEIHPSIRVTVDFPSNHENGRLPVLDVEQWIDDVLVDGVQKKHILHSHYMKKMFSKLLIAVKTKISILSENLLLVMRNVSPSATRTKEQTNCSTLFIGCSV